MTTIKKVIAGKLAVLAFYRHLGESHGLTCDEKKEAIIRYLAHVGGQIDAIKLI